MQVTELDVARSYRGLASVVWNSDAENVFIGTEISVFANKVRNASLVWYIVDEDNPDGIGLILAATHDIVSENQDKGIVLLVVKP